MELPEVVNALLRRWWLVLIVPAVALVTLVVRQRTLPYQVTVRATVLIPGDTEIPGNSERPELMVLDDLPSLVSSRVFAEGVSTQLASGGTTIPAADIQPDLSGSRYSRVLTVNVSDKSSAKASTIAGGVAAVLPEMVNRYLVADGSAKATVQIIDPPGTPTRARANQKIVMVAQVLAALAAGGLLAICWEGVVIARSRPGLADRPDTSGETHVHDGPEMT